MASRTYSSIGGEARPWECNIPSSEPAVAGSAVVDAGSMPVADVQPDGDDISLQYGIPPIPNRLPVGRAWKLKNPSGKRIASLAPDGGYLAP